MQNIISVKDILEVEIIDMNHRGQGVAKVEGFVIFADNVMIGDRVKLEVIEVKKNYAVAKVLEILTISPYKVKPECPYFWECGGCQLMHMDYDKQLEYKRDLVESEIRRSLPQAEFHINDTIGMAYPYRYRNKGSFPVVREKGRVSIGAYKLTSHDIVDLESCIIQHPIADKVINVFRDLMVALRLEPYDEIKHTGLVKHLMVRTNTRNEAMLIIVMAKNKFLYKSEIIAKLLEEIPELSSIIMNVNDRQTNVILGNKNKILYGTPFLKDWIFDLEFAISPQSFFQVNSQQTEALYLKALEFANIDETTTVYDLFCGIGTISLAAAKKAKHVFGIESVKEAIVDANDNAKRNGIQNIDFHCGKAEDVFPKLYQQGYTADVVILDPPRKGCEKPVLETIIEMKPGKVVYVSCNPTTLARDLKILVGGGYEIKEVQPVDMFPHGVHVETIVCLQKKSM